MNPFLFFPPACLTQVEDDCFRINDIHGGIFELGRESAYVYLAQDILYEKRQPDRINMPLNIYNLILDELIRNRIIYTSATEAEKPFDGKLILEKLSSSKFEKETALSIGYVTLDLTQDCPYKCEGCSRENNQIGYLGEDKIKELLSTLKSMGLTRISLSGGEITISRAITEKAKRVVSYALEQGIRDISVLTSGFNSKRLEELIDSGVTEVQISVDGDGAGHNEYKQSSQSYRRAIENIQMCDKKDVKLVTNTVVTKKNFHTIPKTIDTLLGLGVEKTRITKILTQNKQLGLTAQESRNLYEMILKKQREYGERVINTFGSCTNKIICSGGLVYAHIGATGNVFPCDHLSDIPAGNINDSGFEDIWTNSKTIKLFREPKDAPKKCQSCKERAVCVGSCFVEARNKMNDSNCSYTPINA